MPTHTFSRSDGFRGAGVSRGSFLSIRVHSLPSPGDRSTHSFSARLYLRVSLLLAQVRWGLSQSNLLLRQTCGPQRGAAVSCAAIPTSVQRYCASCAFAKFSRMRSPLRLMPLTRHLVVPLRGA